MGFTSNRNAVGEALSRRIGIALETVGQAGRTNAIEEAQKLIYETPEPANYVRTGNYRNSIGYEVRKANDEVYIGSTIEYAPYIEYGTVKMVKRPVIRRAAENHADEYQRIFGTVLSSL